MPYLTTTQLSEFEQNGFLIERNLFDPEETQLLQMTAKDDQELDRRSQGRRDRSGATVRLTLWNHPGDGIYGMFARCKKLVGRMEELLDGEVYHYHSKMILKDPEIGGAWEWHQDYGYWYHYGCLQPLMASAMIAVDPAKLNNGCLEVLKGSHHLGRLDHSLAGDQSGADPERVQIAMEYFERVKVELEPGDTLFFHCNLLHCSGQNHSPDPRWAMICCYNAARNNPFKASRHPQYTPLEQVDDTLIKMVGLKRFNDSKDVDFMGEKVDRSIPSDLHKPMTETV
ncbi:MAG TPA: phytanoyl-CoA dioxygenase family protein [Deltaproteobacteria bacterium]|nr:phytanoyl-CoA dioxygenase family protein [Deltaproteobacteria bacterium]